MTTVRQSLRNANPNSLPDALKLLDLPQAIGAITRTRRAAVSSDKMILPENGKALSIVACYAYGTTSGYFTPLAVGSNVTPTTGQVSINGAGDIVFAAADAITAAIVEYVPYQGDLQVFEEEIDVASHIGTLLGSRRAQVLLSVTSLAGTLTGALTPIKRSSSQPNTGLASIGGTAAVDDSKIWFATADAVTRARVRYLAIPGVGTSTGNTFGESLGLTIDAV